MKWWADIMKKVKIKKQNWKILLTKRRGKLRSYMTKQAMAVVVVVAGEKEIGVAVVAAAAAVVVAAVCRKCKCAAGKTLEGDRRS